MKSNFIACFLFFLGFVAILAGVVLGDYTHGVQEPELRRFVAEATYSVLFLSWFGGAPLVD